MVPALLRLESLRDERCLSESPEVLEPLFMEDLNKLPPVEPTDADRGMGGLEEVFLMELRPSLERER